MIARRLASVLLASVVLGVGVCLTLSAGMGADGYTTFVSGVSRRVGWPFGAVNVASAFVLLVLAWAAGRRDRDRRGAAMGPGSFLQPVVVALVAGLPWPALVPGFSLIIGLALMSVGIAGYLAADLGAGPIEAAALAASPRVSFRCAFCLLQVAGGLVGWWCGADVGLGTALAATCVGPAASGLLVTLRRSQLSPDAESAHRAG